MSLVEIAIYREYYSIEQLSLTILVGKALYSRILTRVTRVDIATSIEFQCSQLLVSTQTNVDP